MRSIKCLLAILLATMTACVFNPNPLEVYLPEVPPKLVISAYSLPPSQMAVTVSRTFSALLGGDSINVDDPAIAERVLVDSALVIVRYGGREVKLVNLAPGLFGSLDVEIDPYETYSLYVKDYETGEEITAETMLLPTVPLDSAYAIRAVDEVYGDSIFSLGFRVLDPGGLENYYLVTYTNLSNLKGSLNGFDSIPKEVFAFNGNRYSIFTDKNSGDGKPFSYELKLPPGNQGDTIIVGLSNISSSYYNFLHAYKRSGSLWNRVLAEPISLPTNVVNGYGYFSVTLPSLRMVVLR